MLNMPLELLERAELAKRGSYTMVAVDGADDDGGTLYVLYDEKGRRITGYAWPQPLEAIALLAGFPVVTRSAPPLATPTGRRLRMSEPLLEDLMLGVTPPTPEEGQAAIDGAGVVGPPPTIAQMIRRFHERHGRVPVSTDFGKDGLPTLYFVGKEYGSLTAAVRAAGLKPNPRGGQRKRVRKLERASQVKLKAKTAPKKGVAKGVSLIELAGELVSLKRERDALNAKIKTVVDQIAEEAAR